MTPAPPIPLLRVAGTYAEVGAAIGAACRGYDRARMRHGRLGPCPPGDGRPIQLALADCYADVTRPIMPWLFEELDGCAEAAGADPRALWACCIEEIWYEPRTAGVPGAAIAGRCSDLVAVASRHRGRAHPDRAQQRHVARSTSADLVAIERTCGRRPDDPDDRQRHLDQRRLERGRAHLTGNELSPNDERIGIPGDPGPGDDPRRTLGGWSRGLAPTRASSYNNVLVVDGGVANVEGRRGR